MNDGSVTVKLDGKKLEEIGEAMRAATSEAVTELVKAGPSAVPEVPQGDGLKTPRAVGATEGEAAPVAPKRIGEPGVRRTKKYLPCVLSEAELSELHRELARQIADVDDATREVDHIKESAKVKVAAATQREKELRAGLADKARTAREGKLHRDVDVTVRINWHTKTKTTTRDDTGEVLDVEPASLTEIADCGVWEKDLKAGKSYLRAPDGAVLDQRNLTDAERQTSLPLADGGSAANPPAPADRAWMSEATWNDLDDKVLDRMVQPDPKGPSLNWVADGKWLYADIPVGLRPQLEHHATQAEIALAFGPDAPTLASLAAASKEPAGKSRRSKAKAASQRF